jgi:zinc and cadmium transporter
MSMIWTYLILFSAVLLSGLTIFLFKKVNPLYLKLVLSFSGAYLFALSVLHLIPEVYSSPIKNIGIYVLAGFLLQIIIEFFSEGIEHGHIHVHKHHEASFPLTIMIGLCLHSFLEGMPLAQQYSDTATNHSLLAGIVLHHAPVAIALMSMMIQSGTKPLTAVIFLSLFGLMAPLGAGISSNLAAGSYFDIAQYRNQVMAIVIGIFLHISTTILFETNEDHRFNYYKLIIILLGITMAVVTL